MEIDETAVVQLLNRQLADTLDLRSQVRQAHFNVKGRYVRELRLLFDGLAQDLQQFADIIAQRISALGGQSAATVRFAAHHSGLREYPLDAINPREHLEALLSGHSRYERDTQKNLRAAQADHETAGLLGTIMTSIERNLWFLEAYLEGIVVGSEGDKLPMWLSTFENRRTPAKRAS